MNTPWGARWSLLCLLGLDDTARFVYQNAYLLQRRKFPGRLERLLAVAKLHGPMARTKHLPAVVAFHHVNGSERLPETGAGRRV